MKNESLNATDETAPQNILTNAIPGAAVEGSTASGGIVIANHGNSSATANVINSEADNIIAISTSTTLQADFVDSIPPPIAVAKDIQTTGNVQVTSVLNFNIHKVEPSPPPLASSIIESYQEKLKQNYQKNNEIHRLFGKALSVSKSYINLSVVVDTPNDMQEQNDPNDNNAGKEISKTTHSYHDERLKSFEDLFGEKLTIKVEDILKSDNGTEKKTARFSLVHGRAGIGKTTFMTYLSYQWASGQLWSEIKWLFKITLRNLTQVPRYQDVTKDYRLEDIVYHECFRDLGLTKSEFDALWQQVIVPLPAPQKLWVLDGYDEISTITNNPHHPLYNVVRDLLWHDMPVLLTSRPYSLSGLPTERQILEITGFTNDNIAAYIYRFFQELSEGRASDLLARGEKLLAFLRSHPSLWGTAHIPINLNLICGIYQDVNQPFATNLTMTQLYQTIEQKLLVLAYQKTAPQAILNEMMLHEIDQVSQQKYAKALCFLEQLAFAGFQNNTLILIPEQIDKALQAVIGNPQPEEKISLFRNVIALGFIRPASVDASLQTVVARAKSYEYLHLTFQEYFTAKAMICGLRSDNNSHFQMMSQLILDHKFDPRYQIIWWFIAGLLREDSRTLALFIDLLQEPATQDRLGDYAVSLLARCYEEAWSAKTQSLWQPILDQLMQSVNRYYQTFLIFTSTKGYLNYVDSDLPLWKMLPLCPRLEQNLIERMEVALMQGLESTSTDFIKFKAILSFLSISQLVNTKLLKNLITHLAHQSFNVRSAAADVLSKLGEKATTLDVVQALVTCLANQNTYVRSEAVQVLSRLGERAATPEVVQALVAYLMPHQDANMCSAAIRVLGYLGEKAATHEVVQVLLTYLVHQDANMREAAADALGRLGKKTATPEVVKPLVDCLAYQDANVRSAAVHVLNGLSMKAATPEVVQALVDCLKHPDTYVGKTAAMALGNLREKAITPDVVLSLVACLALQDAEVRSAAVHVLLVRRLGEKAATPEVVKALAAYLKHQDAYVRRAAAQILGNLGEKAATSEVVQTLALMVDRVFQDIDEHIETADALGKLGEKAATPKVVQALMNCLRHRGARVRTAAATALGNLGEKAAIPDVVRALVDCLRVAYGNNSNLLDAAANALSNLGKKAATSDVVQGLMACLAYQNTRVCGAAARALGNLGEKAATPNVMQALLTCLEHQNTYVRGQAADALGKLGEKAATPGIVQALVACLAHQDPYLRRQAAEALGSLGKRATTPEVMQALVACLAHKNADMCSAAFQLLGNLGEKAVIPNVIQTLAVNLAHHDPKVCIAVIEALGKWGEKAATFDVVQALATNLVHRDAKVRSAAVNVLDKLGEKVATSSVLQILVTNLALEDWSAARILKGMIKHIISHLTEQSCDEKFCLFIFGWLHALRATHANLQLVYCDSRFKAICWIQQTRQECVLSPAQMQAILHLLLPILDMLDGKINLNFDALKDIFRQLPAPDHDKLLAELQTSSSIHAILAKRQPLDKEHISPASSLIKQSAIFTQLPVMFPDFLNGCEKLLLKLQPYAVLPQLEVHIKTLIIILDANIMPKDDAESWLISFSELFKKTWPTVLEINPFQIDNDGFSHLLKITMKTENAAKKIASTLKSTLMLQSNQETQPTLINRN